MVATLAQAVVHLAVGFVLVGGVFPFSGPARRRAVIRWWSGRLLRVFGLRLEVDARDGTGRFLAPGGPGAMLVMNHLSWLDIFVVHSLRPARFIAKAEIGRWPALGWLVDRTGTIFIERGRRHAVREVNHKVAALLADGELVGMFPEGQVGDGERLLPFHANLLQPAIDARAPVVVAGLRYRAADGGPTAATYYVGEITLLQSIVRIAKSPPLVAELRLIERVDGGGATRHALARRARTAVATALGLDDDVDEALEDLSTVVVVPDDVAVSRDDARAGTASGTAFDPRDELL